MFMRYLVSPETAKLIGEQAERDRKAYLLARELKRAQREQEPEKPSWRERFGWRVYAVLASSIAVVILLTCYL